MANRDATSVEGVVAGPLPNAMYRVELADGRSVLAHVGSEARLQFVTILPGDRVLLALSPYHLGRGRITYRYS